jgi:glycolate oxidase FAD binding subunit
MTLRPESIAELQACVRACERVVVRGAGTKSPPGEPTDATLVETRQVSGMTDYAPDECVFTARAGTPLASIDATLRAHGQYLPFDPPLVTAGATIGGTVAMGLSGSGRYRYGGVRDFVIGARVIDGEGTLIRSGGTVVKNAAGFLLHHAIVGSAGRLGVLADLSLKVFPAPEARATLQMRCGSLGAAVEMLAVLNRVRADVEAIDFDEAGTMWVRVAGRAEALPARIDRLRDLVSSDSVAPDILSTADDEIVWARAREFAWAPADAAVVKVPLTSSDLHRLTVPSAHVRFACAGQLAWVAWTGDLEALSAVLHAAHLRGLVVRGMAAGRIIGARAPLLFEGRVRRVLDPTDRFRAASHTDR